MVAQKLWIYVLLSLSLGTRFVASAAEFQGVPLPENTSIVLSVLAEGVQIYESKVNSTGACEWALKAPEAQLKSLSGEVLGKHYGGPSWSLNDGSQLVGNLPPLKTVSAPDGRNIPWLLVARQNPVRNRFSEHRRLCGPDCDFGWCRAGNSAEESHRYGTGGVPGYLPVPAETVSLGLTSIKRPVLLPQYAKRPALFLLGLLAFEEAKRDALHWLGDGAPKP